ncbi:MAG TPA: tyrosine-type recombinase/integrase [Mycobacteriales bacterium]|jgi:integrase|nr:tyrosine-type recombinase/integrase [Mycobacteriales bacterium]
MGTAKRRRSHGEGSVYQRKSDGRWVAAIDAGYVNGKRRRATGYGATEKEALAERDSIRNKLQAGVDLTKRRTLATWLHEWLTIKEGKGLSSTTLDRYRIAIDKHLIPGLGRFKLDALNARHVQQFFESYQGKARPASIIKIHAVLRASLSTAMSFDLVQRNVAKAVKPATHSRDERRVLTVDEAKVLLSKLSGNRLEKLFLVAIATGMRRSELVGLRWIDVDFDQEHLWVRQKLVRTSRGLEFGPPKTHRSKRPIPLSMIAFNALCQQRGLQAWERYMAGEHWANYGLVFSSTIGTPMEPRNVNRTFEAIRAEAGLPWVDLHDLRHAFATYLLDDGEDLRTVMELLGHSTIRLAADTYGHVLQAKARRATTAIDWAFAS